MEDVDYARVSVDLRSDVDTKHKTYQTLDKCISDPVTLTFGL